MNLRKVLWFCIAIIFSYLVHSKTLKKRAVLAIPNTGYIALMTINTRTFKYHFLIKAISFLDDYLIENQGYVRFYSGCKYVFNANNNKIKIIKPIKMKRLPL